MVSVGLCILFSCGLNLSLALSQSPSLVRRGSSEEGRAAGVIEIDSTAHAASPRRMRRGELDTQWHLTDIAEWTGTQLEFLLPSASVKVGQKLTFEDLPADLKALGKTLFGSDEKTEALVKDMSTVSALEDDDLKLIMVAHHSDDTMPRLAREMKGDRYSIRKINEDSGVIVDIGSNIGDVSVQASKIHPKMQILAIEPVPTTYFFLRVNLWLNGVPELQESDLGLADKPGVLALNGAVTSDGRQVEMVWSETFTQDAAVDAHTKLADDMKAQRKSMPSWNLPELLKKHGIDKLRLLKIDCEGCEFEVLPSMKEWITNKNSVERLVGELHQVLRRTDEAGTFASHPPAKSVEATDQVLRARGCDDKGHTSWVLQC